MKSQEHFSKIYISDQSNCKDKLIFLVGSKKFQGLKITNN